jgi:hypothetical protein
MTKIGTVFTFAAPSGWSEFREGSRYVFHGPNREELIMSAFLIQGGGTSASPLELQQRLFRNAEGAARAAASHSALKVTHPFMRKPVRSGLECWMLRAETHEGDTLFHQAVVQDPRGVLLASFEAPNTLHSVQTFEQVVESLGVASEP